ncbi:hypothetical protein [Aeromonas dhakensis]|uniref:hypothetical protein n=1 Tax=Aeromonas dhakensis TaxID=196024 RepID=UPI0034265C8D
MLTKADGDPIHINIVFGSVVGLPNIRWQMHHYHFFISRETDSAAHPFTSLRVGTNHSILYRSLLAGFLMQHNKGRALAWLAIMFFILNGHDIQEGNLMRFQQPG